MGHSEITFNVLVSELDKYGEDLAIVLQAALDNYKALQKNKTDNIIEEWNYKGE